MITNLRGEKKYLVGGSTITQQLVKNFFLTPKKTLRRKLADQYMSLILERRASKDRILEMYLNDVYLGQRGSFAVHGVAEAARLFFGKDISNVTLNEAATIAGVIQSPYTWSPFTSPDRCHERRNVVLRAMAEEGFISEDAARRTSTEPIQVVQRALEAQAPYFVDYVGQSLAEQYPGVMQTTAPLSVYTTLDLHLQRLAQDAVRNGLTHVDELLSRRKRPRRAEAALIAIDPRTGEVLALVGGRSYNQSQYNRAISARRQPGSVFKPFVYLAAFERAAAEGRTDLTPATLVDDMPSSFTAGLWEDWAPNNYENEYDGLVTLRRALALSRNVATIKVAETTGFDRVAALWRALGVGTSAHAYPSITLGVFEATPIEIATAYTIFPNWRRHPAAAGPVARGGGQRLARAARRADQEDRAGRHDLPGHEHDAERDQRRHRRRRASRWLCARCRREVRHHERSARRVVRGIHARAADSGMGGPRRQPAGRAQRHAGRAADLGRVHDPRPRRP